MRDLQEQDIAAKTQLERQILHFMKENLNSETEHHPLDLAEPVPDSGVSTKLYRAIRLLSLRDTLGPRLSAAALDMCGRTMAKRFSIGTFPEMQQMMDEFGFHDLSIERLDTTKFAINLEECPTCSGLPNLGESVCHFESGMIAGCLEEIFDRRFDAIETRCWGLGDRGCTWDVHPADEGLPSNTKPFALTTNDIERLRSDRLRDDLTDMLVHDMRVPLNTIIGSIQTLEEMASSKLDEKEKALLHMAISGGFALLRMTSELLDVSRLEKCELALTTTCCRVDRPISEAVAQVEFAVEQRLLDLSVHIPSDLPIIRMDCDRLTRVLVNLLQNAIKHTPTGGRIQVNASMAADRKAISISVIDSGEGIAKEHHEQIFGKFVKVGDALPNRPSWGLGLAYCKLIVEAHGGRIFMDSEPGQGSSFTFTIPIDPLSQPA